MSVASHHHAETSYLKSLPSESPIDMQWCLGRLVIRLGYEEVTLTPEQLESFRRRLGELKVEAITPPTRSD